MVTATMQPSDIEIGDHVLLKEVHYPFDTIEVRISKIAGTDFQVQCWNPLNEVFRKWLSMNDYEYIGKVRAKK